MKGIGKTLFSLLLIVSISSSAIAHIGPERPAPKHKKQTAQYRADCAVPLSQTELAINNVRAHLMVGGSLWWDGEANQGDYIVPNVDPLSGYSPVSSIFAGGLWMGGIDPAGNLKMACQTYGSGVGRTDFFAGPIPEDGSNPTAEDCDKWDRFFKVTSETIREHLDLYEDAIKNEVPYDPDLIPLEVKGWPGRGNAFFENIHGFPLPTTVYGLAPFFDRNGNDVYEPTEGDYPIVKVRGCNAPNFADEMIFWVFNDAGGEHTETGGDPLQMEVQALSFAYQSLDELDNMTLYRYRIINRAVESIDSAYFALWMDPDLGCYTDDFIGCDSARGLAYIYNEDAIDGQQGCTCPFNVNTYCEHIPMLGVDILRGPLNEFGDEIGMSSFTYYNNGSTDYPAGTIDPYTPQEYYNYLTGSWRDGTPYTYSGMGYNLGSLDQTKYVFSDPPNDPQGWSMCSANLPFGDRRTLQSFGPSRQDPGAVQEMLLGVLWVPNIQHPCPDITPLLRVDDYAEKIFNSCFEIADSPNAPDVDWVELDQEVIAILTNEDFSNNVYESYGEIDICAPYDIPLEDRFYRFEGYKIFQLAAPDVSISELDDPDRARLVYQGDIQNEVADIYNWEPTPNPDENPFAPNAIWEPKLKVEGANAGIQHSIQITEDQFATGADKRLINHRKYYYMAVAYAHNNYETFSQANEYLTGQRKSYLESRRNIKVYTAIPRPILNLNLNSEYGDAIAITRLSGLGNSGYALEIDDDTRQAMLEGTTEGTITYLPGEGPFALKIYNPLAVTPGQYELSIIDDNLDDDLLTEPAYWQIRHIESGQEIESRRTISQFNEQVLPKFGFSIELGQAVEPGGLQGNNGAIAFDISYASTAEPDWLRPLPKDISLFNFIKNKIQEPDYLLDPANVFDELNNGYFLPYALCDYRTDAAAYISPAWNRDVLGATVRERGGMSQLNNIDIVLTKDQSKWSRCVVVETASAFYTTIALGGNYEAEGGATEFGLRRSPSVGKTDNNGDGLPDPDGDGEGMAWFPGYAVDLESGERLNIFFGENSTYNGQLFPEAYETAAIAGKQIGNDMIWNPSSQLLLGTNIGDIYEALAGGQQFVYVTNQPYDDCEEIREKLAGNTNDKIIALSDITWVGALMRNADSEYLPYSEGLIPNDALIKLRVNNSFQVDKEQAQNNGYPTYQFSIDTEQPTVISTKLDISSVLDAIGVVPNPYYGYSIYEQHEQEAFVRITNLPAKCTIRIYNLAGQFIRQFERDEQAQGNSDQGNPGILEGQIYPDLDWDLKNAKGRRIASGTYLIHIVAPSFGERVLKWFGKVPKDN